MVVKQWDLHRLDATKYGIFGEQDIEAHLHAWIA